MKGLIAFAIVVVALPGVAQPLQVSEPQDRHEIEITFGDRLLAVYHYGEALDKPYLHPIRMPSGQAITYDAPADHIHHRGLSIGWPDINGYDFWSEFNSPEGKRGLITTEEVSVDTSDEGITLSSTNRWQTDETAIMKSVHRWVFHTPQPDTILIDVTFSFEALEPVTFGSNPDGPVPYHGLCMRIGPFANHQFFNAEGDGTGNELRGERSAWCAIRGTQFGHPIAVAILDHPENDSYPTPFAVYDAGMQFISTSPNSEEPKVLQPGDSWELTHRIVATSAPWAFGKTWDTFLDGKQ